MPCPNCGKTLKNIPAVVQSNYGIIDDQVLYYYCPHCGQKFSLNEALRHID